MISVVASHPSWTESDELSQGFDFTVSIWIGELEVRQTLDMHDIVFCIDLLADWRFDGVGENTLTVYIKLKLVQIWTKVKIKVENVKCDTKSEQKLVGKLIFVDRGS